MQVTDQVVWDVADFAILGALLIGVGVIGQDGDTPNLMYFGVLAVGIVGAIIAHFQPHGLARTLFATALAQVLVAVIALVAGLGSTGPACRRMSKPRLCVTSGWRHSRVKPITG
jgi:hypothetical protein